MATASSDSAQLAKLQINIESNIKSVFESFQKLFKIVRQADKDGFTPIRKNSDNWKKNVEGIEKTQKGINIQMKQYNDTTAKSSKQMQGLQKNAEAIKTAFSFLKGRAGLLIGGFGIGAMVSGTKAWRTELLALNETFSSMSDATGSTNAAMGVYFNALGKTKAGQQTVIASMKALEDQGLKVGKEFADLTVLGADLSQATGISADTWGNLTGKLNFSWKVPVDGIKKINSALISTGLTGSQLTQVINDVNENIDKLAGFAKDGTKNAIALAAGYAGATKALTKFGISTQKATEFMNKLLDPEHLQDNMLLLAKAGISYSDFTNMLTSDKGKETFFDKLGAGLPRVAQQLQQIQDPISRMNFAKSLGLSTEMVAKLASAGPGEMQKIMREAVNEAKSKDALDKKQKASKEAAAKLDERLHLMRMQLFSGLLPIFERNLPKFMNVLNLVFQRGGDIFKFVGERLESIFGNVAPIFESMLKGNWDEVPKKMGEGFKNITVDIMNAVSNTVMPLVGKFIASALPNMIKGMGAALRGIWEASPIMGLIATLYAGNKIFGPVVQLAWRIREWRQQERLIAAVQGNMLGGGGIGGKGGGGIIGNLLSKIPGVGRIAGLLGMGGHAAGAAGSVAGGAGSAVAGAGGGLLRGGIAGIARFLPMIGGPIGLAVGAAVTALTAAIMGGVNAMKQAGKIFNQGDMFSNMSPEQREKLRQGTVESHLKLSETQRRGVDATGKSREMEAYQATRSLSGAYKDSQVTGGNKAKAFIAGFATLGLASEETTANIAKNLHLISPSLYAITELVDAVSDKPIKETTLTEIEYFSTRKKLGEKLSKSEEARYKKALDEAAKAKTSWSDAFTNIGEKMKKAQAMGSEITDAFKKDGLSGVGGVIKEKFSKAFEWMGKLLDKYLRIPWFNLTYGMSLAIEKNIGIPLSEMIIKVKGVFADTTADKAELERRKQTNLKSDEQFKVFQQAYDYKKNGMDVGTAISRLRGVQRQTGIDPLLAGYADRAANLFQDEKADREKEQREAAELQRRQLEELRKNNALTARGNGIGGQIAENTKPKTERSNVNNWVDFLRNSGMVEAGVTY